MALCGLQGAIRSGGCDVMADKRLWWVPTDINQWRGNPRIQALSDAAYRGYHNLLMTEWQTDDCTLPTEDAELAVLSTLRSRWNKNAPAIRAMFVTVTVTVSGTDTERLRDAAQYEEWLRAKRVHDKQSLSAHRTNEKRSARRSPSAVSATATAPVTESQTETVTAPVNPSVSSHSFPSDSIADRCTITETGTATETGTEAEAEKQKQKQKQKPGVDAPALPDSPPDAGDGDVGFPEGLNEIQYGWRVLEAEMLPDGEGMRRMMGNRIARIARKKQCNMPTAARLMLKRVRKAKSEGVTQWYKWLEDGDWDEDQDFHLKEPEG